MLCRREFTIPAIRGLFRVVFFIFFLIFSFLEGARASVKGTSFLLHGAILKGDKREVLRLLEAGVDVHVRDEFGRTPLHVAAQSGQGDIIAQLIHAGADVSATNFTVTPLHDAVSFGHKEAVAVLLKEGANVHARDLFRKTSLNYAACKGHTEIAIQLIDARANIHTKNGEGDTLLHEATHCNQPKMAALFLQQGIDIEVKDKSGGRPLHAAVLGVHVEIATLLLGAGAKINAKNKYGNTPLHQVGFRKFRFRVERLFRDNGAKYTKDQYVKLISQLIDAGAEINAQNDDGNTPLHEVAWMGDRHPAPKVVTDILLQQGAKINAKNREGKTPLHFAKDRGHTELATLLLNAGAADLNVKDNKISCPSFFFSWLCS